jgi:nuclear GTP-binding protein
LIHDGDDKTVQSKQKTKMTIEGSPFAGVFGPKAQRKRVKLEVSSLMDLAGDSEKSLGTYKARLDQKRLLSGTAGVSGSAGDDIHLDYEDEYEPGQDISVAADRIFEKGKSKRIWNELCELRIQTLVSLGC